MCCCLHLRIDRNGTGEWFLESSLSIILWGKARQLLYDRSFCHFLNLRPSELKFTQISRFIQSQMKRSKSHFNECVRNFIEFVNGSPKPIGLKSPNIPGTIFWSNLRRWTVSSGGEDLVYEGYFVVFACLGRHWIYDKCHSRLVYSGRIGRPWCRSISFFNLFRSIFFVYEVKRISQLNSIKN